MERTMKKYSSGMVATKEEKRNQDAGHGQQNDDDAERDIHFGSAGVSTAVKHAADENAKKSGEWTARVRFPGCVDELFDAGDQDETTTSTMLFAICATSRSSTR